MDLRAVVLAVLLPTMINSNIVSEPKVHSWFDYENQLLYKAIETNVLVKQYMDQLKTALQTMAAQTEEFAQMKKVLEETNDDVKTETKKWLKAQTEEFAQLKKVLEETNADFRVETVNRLETMEQTVQDAIGEARTPIVSFNARSAVDRSPDQDQIMVYKTVLQNIGDPYDSATGIFTAPLAGTFMFNVNVCTYQSKWSQLQLVVDSRDNIILTFRHYNSDNTDSSFGSVTHYLTKGQRVWVQSEYNSGSSNTLYEHSNECWNQFSGTLLNH